MKERRARRAASSEPERTKREVAPQEATEYLWIRRAAGLGLLSALYLTWHYKLFLSGAGDQALCNVSQVINCDRVAASSWSRLLGLPLAVWGAAGYAAILIHTTRALRRFGRWSRGRMPSPLSEYAFSTCVLIAPFALGLIVLPAVSLLEVRALCLGCAVSWIADLVLLVFGIRLAKRTWRAERTFLRPLLPSALMGALAIIPLAWYARPSPSAPNPEQARRALERSPLISVGDMIAADPLTPTVGDPSAPVTIVYFTDFQCPYCKLQTEALRELLVRRPGQVRVIYRHYPLDQTCNRRLVRTAHPLACTLARLAIAAHRRGVFERWAHEIWSAQQALTFERAQEIARRYGLDPQDVLRDPEIERRLEEDIRLAERVGVESTPTLIINGRLLRGYHPVERLEAFISSLGGK